MIIIFDSSTRISRIKLFGISSNNSLSTAAFELIKIVINYEYFGLQKWFFYGLEAGKGLLLSIWYVTVSSKAHCIIANTESRRAQHHMYNILTPYKPLKTEKSIPTKTLSFEMVKNRWIMQWPCRIDWSECIQMEVYCTLPDLLSGQTVQCWFKIFQWMFTHVI